MFMDDQCESGFSGPFRATRLWYQIIDSLRNGVVIKRHRHSFFKQYDNVFSGSNAADVVLSSLLQMGKEISNQEITRENAIKVCQVLMENFIFESVPYGSSTFEDSSRSLYRFVQQDQDNVHQENCGIVTCGKGGEYTNYGYQSTSPCETIKHSPANKNIACENLSDLDTPTSIVRGKRRHSFTAAIRSSILTDHQNRNKIPRKSSPGGVIKPCTLRMSFPRFKTKSFQTSKYLQKIDLNISDVTEDTQHRTPSTRTERRAQMFPKIFSSNIVNNIRERALCHLLTLMDIHFLESILETPGNMQRVSPYEEALTIQNDTTKSSEQSPKCQLAKEVERIPWVRAATACLTYIPEGIDNLWSVQDCKLQCYREVLQYYHNLSSSILPELLLPLYVATLELHQQSFYSKALKALHLLVTILPWQRRDQLHKLLLFLQLVVNDISISIEKEVSNRAVVLRDFTDCIFSNPLISKDHCTSFFSLLIRHVQTVFQIPEWIYPSGMTYCKPLSRSFHQYNYTVQELKSLLNYIINSEISDKRKSAYLRKFKKMHQDIYIKLLEENTC